jgi:hypothetical protein
MLLVKKTVFLMFSTEKYCNFPMFEGYQSKAMMCFHIARQKFSFNLPVLFRFFSFQDVCFCFKIIQACELFFEFFHFSPVFTPKYPVFPLKIPCLWY